MRLQNDFSVLTMQGIEYTIDCSLNDLQMNSERMMFTHNVEIIGM